jgi:hypothetical protein
VTPATLVVPARFNGPPDTGNGGYVAGRLAAHVGGHPAVRVTLREPPPLEVALQVHAEDGQIVASLGGAVVATAEPATLEGDPVAPVPFEVAADAERRYGGLWEHPFPGCFVCGTARPDDGMNLRPGRVADDPDDPDTRVATTWVPELSLGAGDGLVAEPFVWAALDCPSGWSSDLVARPMVLGRVTGVVHARPEPGDRCVVMGRLLSTEGRKIFTASTAYDSDGRVLGTTQATWIAPRRDQP